MHLLAPKLKKILYRFSQTQPLQLCLQSNPVNYHPHNSWTRMLPSSKPSFLATTPTQILCSKWKWKWQFWINHIKSAIRLKWKPRLVPHKISLHKQPPSKIFCSSRWKISKIWSVNQTIKVLMMLPKWKRKIKIYECAIFPDVIYVAIKIIIFKHFKNI